MNLNLPWKLKTDKIVNSDVGAEFEEHRIVDARGNIILEIVDKELGKEIVKRVNGYRGL